MKDQNIIKWKMAKHYLEEDQKINGILESLINKSMNNTEHKFNNVIVIIFNILFQMYAKLYFNNHQML